MGTQSTTPFFGRAWSLSITPNAGPSAGTPILITSDTLEPEALKMTFDITQVAFSAFWHAEITIWNANGPISSGPSKGINLYQAIIQEGDEVTLSAGYQADYPAPSLPPTIWQGPVFYTIQDRVDVVDQRLIIHCLLNRALTTQNFLNDTLPARSTQFSQAQFIASHALTNIGVDVSKLQSNINSASPQRGSSNLPRGKSYFGAPSRYLDAIAEQNGLLSWYDNKNWNTDSLQNPVGPLVATYAPVNLEGGPPQTIGDVTLSLIGQPQQTQLGVDLRVLLDPRVQIVAPLPQIGLELQYVRQAPIAYPAAGGQFPPLPLQNQYVVVGVHFTGDTRGNPWYTDITAVSQIRSAIQLLGQSTQADATGN
jgi:hypothetical protein